MEIKTVIKENGEYQCDIDVTVEEWKRVLQDKTIMNNNYVDVLLKFHSEPEHKSTCKALGIKYEKSPQSFNSTITNFAKAAQKKINRFEVIGTDGESSFWIIPMKGQYSGKHFEWTLRPELVKAIEDVLVNENYFKFKKLLEYFVSHLEWVVSGNIENRGYNDYISPLIEKNTFKKTGQGYKGDNIQKQISAWEKYTNEKICINIQLNYGNYKSNKCYLNWEVTGINIVANWEGENIKSLTQEHYLLDKRQKLTDDTKLDVLGLFDKKENVTDELKNFYNSFYKQILDYNSQQRKNSQMQQLKPYLELLEANKNLILTGAPGTGKTYLAKQIAEQFGEWEFVQFHPSYDYTDFVEGLRPTRPDNKGNIGFELRSGIFKAFCEKAIGLSAISTSHIQNFTIENYEKYLETVGLKAVTIKQYKIKIEQLLGKDFNPRKEIIDRVIYQSLDEICENHEDIKDFDNINNYHNQFSAATSRLIEFKNNISVRTGKSDEEKLIFVFIIDEINRGEISKIFGELFFSIDSGYRGVKGKVKTQYANLQDEGDVFSDGFYVPENVYIIGTMNDIDRSVESMDFAMRRRFAWKEVTALERISMWNGKIDKWKEESEKRMTALNKAIEEIQGLSSAYHIGPAYFLKIEKYKETENPFEHLWENHLKVVIFEYLRGLPNSFELLENLKLSYNMKGDVENI